MDAIAFKHFKGAILKGDKPAHVKALSALMSHHAAAGHPQAREPRGGDAAGSRTHAHDDSCAGGCDGGRARSCTRTCDDVCRRVEVTPAEEPLPMAREVPLAQRKPSRSKAKGKAAVAL